MDCEGIRWKLFGNCSRRSCAGREDVFADTYHWRDGIGERAKRPVTYNNNFGTRSLEYNQFGTHEFMEFCRLIGAKPWFNGNVLSGSVGS